MDIREEIARIVDPVGWERYDSQMENIDRLSESIALDVAIAREGPKYYIESSLQKTDSILSLLLIHGLAIVPVEPTPEMIEAMRLCTIRNSRPVDKERPFESPFTCAVLAAPKRIYE